MFFRKQRLQAVVGLNSSFIRCMLGIRSKVGNACHFDNVVMMGADYQENGHPINTSGIPIGVEDDQQF